jgi:hypothetical protein
MPASSNGPTGITSAGLIWEAYITNNDTVDLDVFVVIVGA